MGKISDTYREGVLLIFLYRLKLQAPPELSHAISQGPKYPRGANSFLLRRSQAAHGKDRDEHHRSAVVSYTTRQRPLYGPNQSFGMLVFVLFQDTTLLGRERSGYMTCKL